MVKLVIKVGKELFFVNVQRANSFFISSIVFSLVISSIFPSTWVKILLTIFVVLALINTLWVDQKKKK
ncbi:hypothetical protein BSQ37_03235 [Pediococcus damnosus]|nr:hypothetical protein BSQ38_07315 [Pediococcus damnosus]PIO85003.1 hypothetical protein BSQ37_03235 [Pediococcus damnosus]PJE49013.1 hypothetical protein BSQ36_03205 [Pediococcus damnosus]